MKTQALWGGASVLLPPGADLRRAPFPIRVFNISHIGQFVPPQREFPSTADYRTLLPWKLAHAL
jgi:hypothetical protein